MPVERKHPDAVCEDCTLATARYVPYYLPKIQQYPCLFIAQAPGEVETYTGVPLTGPAGKMHWRIMKEVGLTKQNFGHDNVAACYPGKRPDGKGDQKPTIKEMMCCFPRLKTYIHTARPKLIVALGEEAMWSLTRLNGISSQRGRIVDLIEDFQYDCKVLIAFHPSYVMRSRQWIPIQATIYNTIHDFFGKGIPEEAEPTLILDPPAEDLERFLDTTDPVGCDTETTGLNIMTDSVIGMSFSKSPDEAVAVAFHSPNDPRWPVIKRFIEDPKRKKIWQNGSYDTSLLRYSRPNPFQAVDQGFYYDTRLAQQLLSSDLPTDLDYLRGEYTSIKPYKPSKKERRTISEWGKEKMLRYAALDAVTTLVVHNEQRKKLSPDELRLMDELLIPLVYAIGRMESRGVRVSTENIASLYAAAAPELERVERIFYDLGVNPRSSVQMKKFFDVKSSNEDTLDYHIKRNHPKSDLMKELLEYRSLHKMTSVYLKGIYKRLLNGRIHTHFKIEGTGTGRLSSEDPNLQNVPDEMRIIYIADDGHVLVKGDHSQVELWTGAIVADEDQMLQDLQSGLDIHYISCQLCFPSVPLIHGNRKQDFTPHQQLVAKTITFGTFYGRTPYSISREFGVTVAEAESWQLKLINKYPRLARYREHVEKEFTTKGYLTSAFGRRRYISSVTQGYNFPVQSAASDITLGSIVAADREGLTPLISVHDDILFQVPIKSFKKDFQRIRKVMERPIPQLKGITFKIDYQKGDNWYELEKVKI